ncbi:hypothetical protein T484DRAFT_1874671 [Baffinella frigidus]|nr:hypothetical protein T484DRAFT_1874671 [Cryptophyta sp. CCMP2293]
MAGALPRRLAAAVWLLAVVVAASSGGSDDPAADDGGGEVVLMLEEEEGVAYARVLRPEGSAGWMELWQEGHRLMANTTELELSIGTRGVDTYLWASLFDADGRWIAQSNVLHTGHHAGVGVSIAASVWERRWEEGEQLQVTFSLPLAPSFEEYKVDAAIFLIDNQTVGMMHLGATVARNDGPLQEWTYVHHGQVEVGEHTLSLAILKPGASSPVAFSPQGWFSVAAASLETRVYTHAWLLPEDAAHLPECSMAFRACFAASAGRVPPNRQYTELLDAAEGCASKLCPGDLDQRRR